MKIFFKNSILIFLLLLANAALYIYTVIMYSPENYLWYTTSNTDVVSNVIAACNDNKRTMYPILANALNFSLLGFYFLFTARWKEAAFTLCGVAIFYGSMLYLFRDRLVHNYYILYKNQLVPTEFSYQPLFDAGNKIGYKLMGDLKDPSYKYRMKNVKGLGQLNFTPAAPLLDSLLYDTTETFLFRAEVYRSLTLMDDPKSRDFVHVFSQSLHEEVDKEFIGTLDSLKYREIANR